MARLPICGILLAYIAMIGKLDSTPLDSSVQNTIETRVIVDKWAFSSWKSKVDTIESQRVSQTQVILENFIYSAFNDLNSIFKTMLKYGINLDARIVSIEFITGEAITAESPPGSGQGRSETVLDEFRAWLATKNYAQTDHTMLLTGLDLMQLGNTSRAGMAFLGGMCGTTKSLSVSELTPSSNAVQNIAHGLGVSLNAEHDSSACGEGFIMDSSHTIGDGSPNNFRFSSCSVTYFKNYLQDLQDTGSCLSAADTSTPAVSAQPLGELYTPDDICRLVFGPSSYLCRTFFGGSQLPYSKICQFIICKYQGTVCLAVHGSDGFACGQGKRCSLGNCEASDSAPQSATDTCPQGDTPGIFLNQQTCAEAIRDSSGFCGVQHYRLGCCESCS